jgi:hypothetical protein
MRKYMAHKWCKTMDTICAKFSGQFVDLVEASAIRWDKNRAAAEALLNWGIESGHFTDNATKLESVLENAYLLCEENNE